MNTLKRWAKTVRWLLNRPPTGHTQEEKPFPCDYCGKVAILGYDGVIAFCSTCMKKVFDKVLKEKK